MIDDDIGKQMIDGNDESFFFFKTKSSFRNNPAVVDGKRNRKIIAP